MKKIILRLTRFLLKLILPIFPFASLSIDTKVAEKEIGENYKKKEWKKVRESQNQVIEESLDLSIIIPVYNSEKLLQGCLDSVMRQKTKFRFEVIVVNDGSTDGSLEILKRYANVIRIDKKNEGVAVARNVGLDCAKGKYVAFVDSDDQVAEDYVEKLLFRAYQKNADIVKCNFTEYSIAKNSVVKYERHPDVSIAGELGERIVEFKGFVWGGIFKRDLWKEVRFLPQYWYEDMIVRLIVFRKCRQFEYINEDLYCYQNHTGNISKAISRTENIRCLDHLFLVKELLEMAENLGLEKDVALYKVLLQELGPILWLRTRDLSEENRKYAFVIGCEMMQECKVECHLNWEEKFLEKAFATKKYLLWKGISIDMMLGVKIGNE